MDFGDRPEWGANAAPAHMLIFARNGRSAAFLSR